MVYIRKNIWELFAITMVIGLLILGYVLFSLWEQVSQRYQLEQENLTKVSAHTTLSMLSQYEVTLDILGEYLMKDETYKDITKSRILLKNLLKTNSSVAGFGLVNTAGKLYVTSIDKSVDELPNLLERDYAIGSFKETLKSDHMVVGRTYYHDTLGTYIIPIRKAIKDANNKVLAVMTAGIKVNDWYLSLKETDKIRVKYKSFLLRDSDYYFQLAPATDVHKNTYYTKAIPKEYAENIKKIISENNNMSIEKIKDKEAVVSAKYVHFITKKEVLASIEYIKKYKLWSIVQIDCEIISIEYYKKMLPIVIIFIGIGLFLFFLFFQLSKLAKKNRNKLERQAEHDYLTTLNNRYYLSKTFEDIVLIRPFALIILDIDNFKTINENFGHKCGDITLNEVGLRLQKIKKDDDIIVRYSGNEFLFVRYNVNRKEAPFLANEIISELDEPYEVNGKSFILSVSLGVAGYPSDGQTFDEIKKYADIALQEAKKRKNTYMFFEDSIKRKYLRHSKIEQELKRAIENDEIYMVYQPQVRSDGSLYGVEALVRWENRELGFIPPDEFISIAESSGMMVKLGQYIIDTSLQEIIRIQRQSDRKFQLSINISIKQFVEVDFYKNLLESIERADFDKTLLTLEVTENLFIEDIESILELLKNIQKDGIKISLDDFGTGYSSLSLLKKLPINELKIDKSFIDDVETDEDAVNMIKGVILIGQQLKMELLAEGIETLKQKEILCDNGCNLFQGYHFSRPLKKEALLNFL